MEGPFQSALGAPFGGLPENLVPNAPPPMPGAPGAGDAMASLSPFTEPQDIDSIIAALKLNRPLKLFIPDREKYADHDFRIVNGVPHEIAKAERHGWKAVTLPELTKQFESLVAGTDDQGKAMRPILMARPKQVTAHIAKQQRKQLAGIYAGMDPSNKQFDSKYAKKVGANEGTEANFSGAGMRIRA